MTSAPTAVASRPRGTGCSALVGRTGPRRRTGAGRRALTGWGFVSPAVLVIVGLSIFPAGWAFLMSRSKWNGFSEPKAIGWDNYTRMVSDPNLADAVKHTLLFTALFVPSSILLGILLAVALKRPIRFV